ncbi:MAG: membrane protein insertion efficiency factor YidD [Rhodanobacteraceae bacterium]
MVSRLLLFLLAVYKRWISPLLGSRCRFYPSCSDYARVAIARHGSWRGSILAAWRIARCQPLCHGGEDPVPEQFTLARCRPQKAEKDTR